MAADVGPPRSDRLVGIFYFLWHNNRGGKSPHWNGPYNVSKIMAADPGALQQPESPLWGPHGTYHYWGEPLYGYYLSDDSWVLRRHALLLADAGVDTLILDATNAVTYRKEYMALCKAFHEVRTSGSGAPQIAFMLNTKARETADKLYREFYQPGLFRESWFQWQGKPLLVCDPEKASSEVREFFTLRRAHWPFTQVNTPYAWHWEATYPQAYGYTENPDKPEQVNVSVAQNLRVADGIVTNMSDGDARGRSFHSGRVDVSPDAVDRGLNFQEQWQRAFELDPPFVMVTGWNEWIAGRWRRPGKPLVFVDQLDQKFSRDIEPMQGGHRDNYYWQLVANVRRYKGCAPVSRATGPVSIDLAGSVDQWRDVGPVFQDHVGDTMPRDHDGAAGLHYLNQTGRNDLVASKLARDTENIWFYVRTRDPPTPHSDKNWMWLLIDADQDSDTGWEGYDFIVNRSIESSQKTWIERHAGEWGWQRVVETPYRVHENGLHLVVPRRALGLPAGRTHLAIDFKWSDNCQRPGDIMDFYESGDVAPESRFKYRYVAD